MVAIRLFIYGTMLSGEPNHAELAEAKPLGPIRSAVGYSIVELPALAGLVLEGSNSVLGELYEVESALLMRLMKQTRHPGVFQLRTLTLDDGTQAEAFMLDTAQARGKRRIKEGDWRGRFARPGSGGLQDAGTLVSWARHRHRQR